MRPALLDGLQRLVGVAGRAGRVALVLEDARDEIADVGLVVDDQDVRWHRHRSLRFVIRSGGLLLGACRDRRHAVGCGVGDRSALRRADAGKRHAHERAARAARAPGGASSSVRRPPCCSMIFWTMARPRPVPFAALGRHVGLEQARAVLLRQAEAVVDHLDDDLLAALAIRRASTRPFQPAARSGCSAADCDRLGRVLDEIGQRLRDQAPVARRPSAALPAAAARSRSAGWLSRNRITGSCTASAQVGRRHLRLRHAGERGELVDHALDVADLAHDRVGELLEGLAVLDDAGAVLALEAARPRAGSGSAGS